MNKTTLLSHSKTLQSILQFFEAERTRCSSILNLVGVETAKLVFTLPEFQQGRQEGTQACVDAIALALSIEYQYLDQTHSVACLKLGAITQDGVPVLQFPGMSPSVNHILPLMKEDTESQDAMQYFLNLYKGMHPMDAFSQIATKLLILELNEQAVSTSTETNDISA